jgi:hypothetical protein
VKKSDPRYQRYLAYQRRYQKNRRETDNEFRLKRNSAVQKCYHNKKVILGAPEVVKSPLRGKILEIRKTLKMKVEK